MLRRRRVDARRSRRSPRLASTRCWRALEALPDAPAFETVRAPEPGLVMARGRIGGGGAPFNLGEVTVTRAVVRIESGEVGFGHVLGRDTARALLVAKLDALWQSRRYRAVVETRDRAGQPAHRRRGCRDAPQDRRHPRQLLHPRPRRGRMIPAEALLGGFADPVFESQSVFRGVLTALSRPGQHRRPCRLRRRPVAARRRRRRHRRRARRRHDSVWLDAALSGGRPRLGRVPHRRADRFGSGKSSLRADRRPARDAGFADFAQGTAEYPDRSATLILQVESFDGGPELVLKGPGIKDSAKISPHPLPADFVARMRANRALFPRGVDLFLVAGDQNRRPAPLDPSSEAA